MNRYVGQSSEVSQLEDLSLFDISHTALEELRFGDGLIRPAYESFCFANLPGFIEKTLVGKTDRTTLPDVVSSRIDRDIKNVLFVFIDAFGWESFEKFKGDSQFLQAFEENGHIVKTTSQFPSTTAAHVTTLNSGMPVYDSGVCEWYYYEPLVNDVINPFQLRSYTDSDNDLLLSRGFKIGEVLPNVSFSAYLEQKGVSTYSYSPLKIASTSYNRFYQNNESAYSYRGLSEAVREINEKLNKSTGKEYHSLYFDSYDSSCHDYGPFTKNPNKVIKKALRNLDSLIPQILAPETLCIVTADHGQVPVEKEDVIKINEIAPEIIPFLLKHKANDYVRFGGGTRDLFLYTEAAKENKVAEILRNKIGERAVVYTQAEALEIGLLGPVPMSQKFKERMGSVLILPKLTYGVHWNERLYPEGDDKKGYHGGASLQEMETPLLLL